MLRFLSLILLSLVIARGEVFAFVGEGAGLDLYETIDKGADAIRLGKTSRALVGSVAKINAACAAVSGIADTFKLPDFTRQELDALLLGDLRAITAHLTISPIETPRFEAIRQCVEDAYNQLIIDATLTEEFVQHIGSMGIYSDGSLENSDYDLMYDIELINQVIFSKEIRYEWAPSTWGRDFFRLNGDFWGGVDSVFAGGAYWSPYDGFDRALLSPRPPDSPYTGFNTSSSQTGSTPSASSQNAIVIPTEVCGTGGLTLDISTLQALYGSATNTPIIANGLSSSTTGSILGSSWVLSASGSSLDLDVGLDGGNNALVSIPFPASPNLYDSFPCTEFFCITISTVRGFGSDGGTYQTPSIERVVAENRKVANKFSNSSSLTPAKFTNNFGECTICSNLNLADALHFQVSVSTTPVPFRKLNPASTPKGAPKKPDTQKTREVVTYEFLQKAGFRDPKRVNDLWADRDDWAHGRANLTFLTTNSVPEKIATKAPLSANNLTNAQQAFIENNARLNYDSAFAGELLTIANFSQEINNSIVRLAEFAHQFRAIPIK